MIAAVLQNYGIDEKECSIQVFGSGLINTTWDVKRNEEHYILQRINHTIFKQPEDIAENISAIEAYLKTNYPGYLFVAPIKTIGAKSIVKTEDGYFRLFPFVQQSHTINVATNPAQAFEAAKQFGAFTKKLSGFNTAQLKITLPDFHNLSLRYQQFEKALLNGNAERITASSKEIALLQKHKTIADDFKKIKENTDFMIRVTHHDTKISNVLFDEKDKGLCVIDLDTVMPGYFISDVGDMMRTYLSPVSEEEKDFSKIEIRKEYLDTIINGYLSEMENELTDKEKQAFIYAGKFMIYMQALRFLTDHLNNDLYYGARYEGHNFVRGKNQLVLLEKLIEIE